MQGEHVEPKIVLNNVNFFYGAKQVIRDFNLSIPKNEIMAVFGPANSGVTTLLRSMNRLCDLDIGSKLEGEILLDDKNIYDNDVNVTELRRKVGMVFEVPTPLPISIFDNISFGPRLLGGKNRKELADIVEQSLQRAALWDEVKDRLSISGMSLSGGQQQRMCIARVLALQPEVILIDRACSGLDPISTAKIEESLMELKEHFTIIIAPHNVQQAGRVCDRAVFMLMGNLVEQGTKEEVFVNPKDQRTSDYISGRFG